MNRNTKILAAAFGAVILYMAVSSVVYPNWIRPWFTLDEQIASKEQELEKLQELKARVGKAREEYRAWVDRVGSFDEGQVKTDVTERLNKLIEEHHLEESKLTPGRANVNRKNGLVTTTLTVTATGTLEQAISFLKDVSELPQLVRVLNPSFSPASSSRNGLTEDRLSVKVPIEFLVLPQNKVVEHIDPAKIVRPEFYVRHQGRDYSPIWSGQPFTDYVPLAVQANPMTVQVTVGQPAALNVSASGGHGGYKYEWVPPEGLNGPDTPTPQVDTSEPGSKRYTVKVTDATGYTAQATVAVMVSKPVEPHHEQVAIDPRPQPPPPPPQPKGPQPWPDAPFLDMRMTLLQSKGDEREDEVMLFNSKTQKVQYVAVGEEFDGGKLIYVHQRGAVGLRGDKYFVYPLGMTLSQAIPAENAEDYPELLRAATFHKDAVAAAISKKQDEAEAARAPGLQVPQPQEAVDGGGASDELGPPLVAEDEAAGPPAPADVTAAPVEAAGTNGDGPPADAVGDGPPADAANKNPAAKKEQTGHPNSASKRSLRGRRPR